MPAIHFRAILDAENGAILYIEERSLRAARRFAGDLIRKVDGLVAQPDLGVPVELDGQPSPYRRVVCGDYAVYHRLEASRDVLFIVRVWHTARNPSDLVLE